MANIFTLDGANVACCIEENLQITEEYICTKDQFTTQFTDIDLSNIRSISYEPARNIYHVLDGDNNLSTYDSATDNDLLSYIDTNYDTIKAFVVEKDTEAHAAAEAVVV